MAKQHEAELLASLEGEPAAASKEQSEKAKKKREKRRRQQEAKRAAQAQEAETQTLEQQAVAAQATEITQTTTAEAAKATVESQACNKKKEKRRRQLERKAQGKKAAAASEQVAAQANPGPESPLTESEMDAIAQLLTPTTQHDVNDATDAQHMKPELDITVQSSEGAEPEPAQEPEPELEPEPEPDASLAMSEWSPAQVLEWVVTIGLPIESASTVRTVLESLGLDGEELIDLKPKMLQKRLQKSSVATHSVEDAAALAKRVLTARDAAAGSGSGSGSVAGCGDGMGTNECRICFEVYTSEADSARVPRILTCGHTYCQECIRTQLTTILAQGNSKPYSCPECREITHVPRGQASRLTKNHHIAR